MIVWYIDPAALAGDDRILSSDEIERAARFRFPDDRVTYTGSHVLLRLSLSRVAPLAPVDWRFSTNRYGRPEIANEGFAGRLRFNLSHTKGLAACVTTAGEDCGVDVERIRTMTDLIDVRNRVFSPAECSEIGAAHERFFEHWTLKEAYVKARGIGLSMPLQDITFERRGRAATVEFGSTIEDEAGEWQFQTEIIDPRYRLAVAIRRGSSPHSPIAVEPF